MGIFLDYTSTSPVDPLVIDSMCRAMQQISPTPHSRTHAAGREAHRRIEMTRDDLRSLVGASDGRVVFTSGEQQPIADSAAAQLVDPAAMLHGESSARVSGNNLQLEPR